MCAYHARVLNILSLIVRVFVQSSNITMQWLSNFVHNYTDFVVAIIQVFVGCP